jgi:predicted component of type VI protein secretion system
MKTISLHVTNGTQTTRLLFTRFPVRIGREAPSECVLDFPFVSKVHALVDFEGDALVLRDAGSRNGTFIRAGTERVGTAGGVPLASVGDEFQIGTLRLRASVLGARDGEQAGTGTFVDHGADMAEFRPRWVRVAEADPYGGTQPGVGKVLESVATQGDPNVVVRTELEHAVGGYLRAREELRGAIAKAASRLDATGLVALLANVAGDCPELVLPVEVREMVPPPPESSRRRAEQAALERLRELAALAAPHSRPLSDAEAVDDFVQRLGIAFRALVEAFAGWRGADASASPPGGSDAQRRPRRERCRRHRGSSGVELGHP